MACRTQGSDASAMPVLRFTSPQHWHPAMLIPGREGNLEAWLERPAKPTGIAAVLCHPHPLYGGNMHDGVLEHVARALLAAGITCLRFNFRGVGASHGAHDGGDGEVDDLLQAIGWLERETSPRAVWLAGYSFGAHVVWQSLARGATPARVLLIAPPIGRMPFEMRTVACLVDIFVGAHDEFVDPDALAQWHWARQHVLRDADHFFAGCGAELESRLTLAIG